MGALLAVRPSRYVGIALPATTFRSQFSVNVHIPKDKLTKEHNTFGFVEFKTEHDADYAMKIMNGVKLFQKPIRVNKVWVRLLISLYSRTHVFGQASKDKKTNEIGANLFVGSLDPDMEEKTLWEVFSAFGYLINPPKVRFSRSSSLFGL